MSILEKRYGSKPACRIGITLVHGLLTGNKSSWSARLAEWGNLNTYADFSTLKYTEGLLGWGHASHVRELAELLRSELAEQPSGQQHAIGHSNGCRLLLEVLVANPDIVLDDLHLIAAWASTDCRKHLNIILNRPVRQVKRAFLYVSPVDEVLGWNKLCPWYFDLLLGKEGPANASPQEIVCDDFMDLPADETWPLWVGKGRFKHCGWVNGGDLGFNFDVLNKMLSLSAPLPAQAGAGVRT